MEETSSSVQGPGDDLARHCGFQREDVAASSPDQQRDHTAGAEGRLRSKSSDTSDTTCKRALRYEKPRMEYQEDSRIIGRVIAKYYNW